MKPDFLRFISRMQAIGKMVDFDADEAFIALYDTCLVDLGYDNVCKALEQIAERLMPGSRKFPSIAEIKKQVTGQPLPHEVSGLEDIEAREAASGIIAASHKFGEVVGNDSGAWQKLVDIAQFLGPIGWDLVERRGGWNYVNGSLTNANMANMEVQFRELAKGAIERRRRGESLASLPKPHIPQIAEPRARLTPLSEADVFPPFLLAIKNRSKKETDDAETTY